MVAYSPPGFLLYIRQKALIAERFDAASLQTLGAPFPVVADMEALGDTQPTGYARFSVSGNGVLAVRSGVSSVSQFAWVDREGKKLSTVGSAGEQDELAISPDEKYVGLILPPSAAAVLAVTPVTVLLSRGNVSDSLLILLLVRDEPGVIAAVSETLAEAGVSIDSFLQKPVEGAGGVPIVLTTHDLAEAERLCGRITILNEIQFWRLAGRGRL